MNYLQLVNRVLSDLNEVEITDVANTRGVQTTAKNAVDSAMRDIINEEIEWPFLHTDGTQSVTIGVAEYDLPSTYRSVDWDNFILRPIELFANGDFTTDLTSWDDVSAGTGSIAHSALGDGRMRLTGDGTDVGAAEQAISTVVGKEYHVTFRFFNGDTTINVGNTSGGTEVTTETRTLDNDGQGFEARLIFRATATTTYVGFSNISTTYVEVDQASLRRDVKPVKLRYLSYDEYVAKYKADAEYNTTTDYNTPEFIYSTQNNKMGLHPVPDEEYQISYEYWTEFTDLTANADTPSIPDRYHDVITIGAKASVLELRDDPVFRDRAVRKFEKGIARMRTDLINKTDYMKAI